MYATDRSNLKWHMVLLELRRHITLLFCRAEMGIPKWVLVAYDLHRLTAMTPQIHCSSYIYAVQYPQIVIIQKQIWVL